MADDLREQRRKKREEAKEKENYPSTSGILNKIVKKLKRKNSSEEAVEELDTNLKKALVTKRRHDEVKKLAENELNKNSDEKIPTVPTQQNTNTGQIGEPATSRSSTSNGQDNPELPTQPVKRKRGRPRKNPPPLPVVMIKFLRNYEREILSEIYDEVGNFR
ncbi:hypothetical protein U1Q18_051050 [Sarracenia purpurea var. burkii]